MHPSTSVFSPLNHFSGWARFALCVLVLAFLCGRSQAQDTGSITGTVTEPTGAVIANATVTVTDTATGAKRDTVSNGSGEYTVAGLRAGTYNVTIDASGFKKAEIKGLVLRVAQVRRVDAKLEVGAVTSEVTVTAGAPAVDTQTSEVAGVVTGKEMTQLQLNGRNFTQLIALTPGVGNSTGMDEGGVGVNANISFNVNGGRWEYNNWEVDGGDVLDNGSNDTLNVYPSLDAISEVKILTSNYGAQYGRSASGTVEIETKSGGTAFHGDVYEFLRNDIFNARNFFSDPAQPKPAYKKNDFGYTLGGPVFIPGHYNVQKNKTFFFWSQEWRRDRVPGQFFLQQVPSNAERTGNFQDMCPAPGSPVDPVNFPSCPVDPNTGNYFPNNQLTPSPTGLALLNLIPAPTTDAGANSLYQASPNQPTNWRQELFRIDHYFNDRWHASFRFIHDSYKTITPTTLFGGNPFPTVQSQVESPGVSMVARLTTNPSPTLVNEFVASYTTDHLIVTPVGSGALPGGFTMGSLFNNGFGGLLPAISLSDQNAYGGGFDVDSGPYPAGGWRNSNPTYTYRDNVTKVWGKHNLQFGAYYVAAQKNEPNASDIQGFLTFDSSSAVTTGNSFADLLIGQVASYSQTNAELRYYNRYKIFEPYIQDDWRVTSRLTVNLGLRISMFGTYRDISKRTFNWVPSAYNPATAAVVDPATGEVLSGDPNDGLVQCGVGSVPAGCMEGHLWNPAPRVGFAYDPFGDGKTAVRGAYGIFYEHTNGNESNSEALEGSAPLVQTQTQFFTDPLATGYGAIGGGGVTFPNSVVAIPNKAVWPYMQQWQLSVEREISKRTIATVAYVGSKGTHLNLQRDINQLAPLAPGQNPYQPGQPLTSSDCLAGTANGVTPVPGTPLYNNFNVACGNIAADSVRPVQGLSNIIFIANDASSSYNALQASVRRTMGNLILNVAYTWSHSIDDSSDRYDTSGVNSLAPERASSNFDQRHLLNISYVYDLPQLKGRDAWVKALFSNWQFAGITTFQTGQPFSVFNTAFGDNAGTANELPFSFTAQSYPDLIGNPNSIPPGTPLGVGGGPLFYNPNAFAEPTGLTYGNAGRNALRNPARTNFDMALYRNIPVTERTHFEFRAEGYNIFNHPQFEANPAGGQALDQNFGSPTFLQAIQAHSARIFQFGLKFMF